MTLLNIYKSLVRGVIDYSLPTITRIGLNVENNKLIKIQNEAIRLAMDYRNSTPLRVLYNESKTSGFATRAKILSTKYIVKKISYNNHPTINLLDKYHNLHNKLCASRPHSQKTVSLHCYNATIAYTPKILPDSYLGNYLTRSFHDCYGELDIDPDSGFNINNKSTFNAFITSLIIKKNLESPPILLFTDGSVIHNGKATGLGIYSTELNISESVPINPLCDIFTAENYAIMEALKVINSWEDYHIIISDSLSTLKALKSNVTSDKVHPINFKLKLLLTVCLSSKMKEKGGSITIAWMPSHCGIIGNDKANSLTKKVTLLEPDNSFLIPHSNIVNHIDRTTIKEYYSNLKINALIYSINNNKINRKKC